MIDINNCTAEQLARHESYMRNREKVIARVKKYRETHKEELAKRTKAVDKSYRDEYYHKNRLRICENARKRYALKKEKENENNL